MILTYSIKYTTTINQKTTKLWLSLLKKKTSYRKVPSSFPDFELKNYGCGQFFVFSFVVIFNTQTTGKKGLIHHWNATTVNSFNKTLKSERNFEKNWIVFSNLLNVLISQYFCLDLWIRNKKFCDVFSEKFLIKFCQFYIWYSTASSQLPDGKSFTCNLLEWKEEPNPVEIPVECYCIRFIMEELVQALYGSRSLLQ